MKTQVINETNWHKTSVVANYDYQSCIDCIIHIAVINLILSYPINVPSSREQRGGGVISPAKVEQR